ncbi:DUF515 domain-containing protein [uncultured Methanobrevibacter sp.]|uniref:DUF515 domain-containing protein n=1 Tax=uncultured Methanobrevibacter sp. TaxID=253161 RepID=UPI0025EF344E|nr:DUF515 domain-containing protein [uncultured Methanobrevibacter sp.]
MNNKKPRDPYSKGFKQPEELNNILPKPKPKDDELSLLKKFNHKLGVYLNPSDTNISENEKKRKIGVIITILILFTLIISAYYFLIYEPTQKELSLEKTTKLNELHELYTGALAISPNEMNLENKIKNGKNIEEIEMIDILTPATKDWKSYHQKAIHTNIDKYNRTMAVYSNESKNVIMSQNDAIKIVNENDATILSKIKFEKPNTVSVPILVSRLQAGAGLVNVGSIVDIYTNLNNTYDELPSNNTNPDISGCTVLSIMRYEENGEVDSEYSKSKMNVHGNITNPQENSKKFSSNVLEMIKGSMMNGYNEKETFELLKNYGIKLSNYERQINLGDLDAQYMLLIETPQDKVNFMLNNMDNIVLTIPTTNAPDWMINEISSTYAN